jgi:large subunit ribosomal protein L4
MTTLPVFDLSGNKVGDYEIDPAKIAPKISKQLLHDVVVMYLANQRQGSNKTKSRGEVSGSTKKLFKQKGTGNARMGAKAYTSSSGRWSR